ncbi:MAG: hypothetical protein CL677_05100 [Bdellovibrionaceae bacterium]|nr:hypothetical protein [Pseudobdellovibrionaceae bacterium]|tara:strand:- start:196 stop:600 length:405 start_codon:yes stop_codon:yes gene_type:complete
MASDNSDVVVKKVQPYPILVNFDDEKGQVFAGNIVKLTTHGFLVELNETVVRIQQRFICRFEFPVMGKAVQANAHVVKTYDQFRDPSQPPVNPDGSPATGSVAVRLAELHFIRPDSALRELIKKFLVAIGQLPR